jgi:hypothetical protein
MFRAVDDFYDRTPKWPGISSTLLWSKRYRSQGARMATDTRRMSHSEFRLTQGEGRGTNVEEGGSREGHGWQSRVMSIINSE